MGLAPRRQLLTALGQLYWSRGASISQSASGSSFLSPGTAWASGGARNASAAAAAAAAAGPHAPPAKRLGLAGVQHVVAVASGKGGVGKSTVAVNMAVALASRLGLAVGLVDADVHGPSVPTLMGLEGEPLTTPEGLMVPQENFNVRTMSMGFFTEADAPIVWRGPMATKALDKMMIGTDWGRLDVLVVDMPPGTGDAQISLGQRLPLSGAVIVSTPQDVALLDARRGAQMFRTVRVPLLGLVDNMAHFDCPACGHREAIFGEGGVQRAAEELGLDVLGQVPIDVAVRIQSDDGIPIVIAAPESQSSKAYTQIAQRVWDKLKAMGSGSSGSSGGPKISIS